jgi:hypothetical protein
VQGSALHGSGAAVRNTPNGVRAFIEAASLDSNISRIMDPASSKPSQW